jgi:hypothetical protein
LERVARGRSSFGLTGAGVDEGVPVDAELGEAVCDDDGVAVEVAVGVLLAEELEDAPVERVGDGEPEPVGDGVPDRVADGGAKTPLVTAGGTGTHAAA